MDSKDALEVYKACLQHTLKLIISFISFFSILCLLFGYYIYKSYDVVPATITATQGMAEKPKWNIDEIGKMADILKDTAKAFHCLVKTEVEMSEHSVEQF